MHSDGGALVNLTQDPGHDSGPVWSPDGSMIVFTSERDGKSEIYVTDADGGNQVNLTSHHAYEDEPRWAPTP